MRSQADAFDKEFNNLNLFAFGYLYKYMHTHTFSTRRQLMINSTAVLRGGVTSSSNLLEWAELLRNSINIAV